MNLFLTKTELICDLEKRLKWAGMDHHKMINFSTTIGRIAGIFWYSCCSNIALRCSFFVQALCDQLGLQMLRKVFTSPLFTIKVNKTRYLTNHISNNKTIGKGGQHDVSPRLCLVTATFSPHLHFENPCPPPPPNHGATTSTTSLPQRSRAPPWNSVLLSCICFIVIKI